MDPAIKQALNALVANGVSRTEAISTVTVFLVRETGCSVEAAMDKVAGEGTYKKLVDATYTALRSA